MLSKKNLSILTVGVTLAGLLAITQTGASQTGASQTGASNQGQGQYKLGGAWVGHAAGLFSWTALQAPINPEATKAGLRVNFTSYSAELVTLTAQFGADSWSDFVGQEVMINRDTARWTVAGYWQAKVNNVLQIRAILVAFGTLQFIDPDHDVIHTTLTVYRAATADANGDGMPDPGSVPEVIIPNITETGQRVPLLQ